MKKLRLLFVALLAFAGVAQAVAQEAYAVVTKNDSDQPVSVTFYYDTNKASYEGTGVTIVDDLNAGSVYDNWTSSTLASATFDASFANYHGLTSLERWFYYCSGLTAITGMENLNTENVTTMGYMFNNCEALTELDLSSFNTSQVTIMTSMFQSCENLETIYVGDGWNTASVTTSGLMFTGVHKIVGGYGTAYYLYNEPDKTFARVDSPEAPGYLTQKDGPEVYAAVTKDEADNPVSVGFYYDNQKKNRASAGNVTIIRALNASNVYRNWYGATLTSATFDASFANYHGLKSLYLWFSSCSNLTSITGLEYLNTENVTTMESMFSGCISLTGLDLTNFDVSSVTTTYAMFYNCSNLETIYAKGDWNTMTNAQGSAMFYGCSKLVGGALTQIGGTWDKTYAHVDGGPSNPGLFTDKDAPIPYAVVTKNAESKPVSVAFYYDKSKDSRAGDNVTIVRALNSSAVNNNWSGSTLTSVTFDESFADFDALKSLYRWFYTCSNLTSITGLEYLNTENVTTMESMFSNCTSLTELDLSHFNTSNVTTMENMFYNCSSLKELDLTNFDVSNVTKTVYMFGSCILLEAIYASTDWSAGAISSSNSMFSGCNKLSGGQGTIVSTTDKTYARLDGGPSSPGYFSQKGVDLAYAVLTKDADDKPISVAFYYDNSKDSRAGENVTIVRTFNAERVPEWAGTSNSPSTLASVTFDPSFANYHGLTSCYYWFSYCQNLATINGLEYLNTENVTTMVDMFVSCKSLTELDLSHFNTAQVTNMSMMFNNCSNLESIYAGDGWNTSSVQIHSSMFTGDEKLVGSYGTAYDRNYQDKTYARLDGGPASPGYLSQKGADLAYAVVTKNAENQPISVAFYYDKLKDTRAGENVTIVRALNALNAYTNWNGSTLTSVTFDESFGGYHGLKCLRYWFSQCLNLTSISGLEYLNTENVTTMEGMFYNCYSFTKLDLSSLNTSSVTSMYYMFRNCTSLTELDLTGFDVSSVTDFGSMFAGCKKLETIYATGDWTTAPASFSDCLDMFSSCEKLLGGAMTPYNTSYTYNTYARLDEGTLKPGYFSKKGDPMAYAVITKNTENKPVSVAFYCDTQKDSRAGENVTIVRRLISKTNDYAYSNWYGATLTSVTFDPSFADFDGLTSLYRWFSSCSNLTSITGLEYLNTKNVTTMESMFSGCTSLTGIDLSGFNTSNVTTMERMFSSCSSLTALDLSHFNTGSLTNMYYMFYNCSSLTDINLTGFTAANVTNMEGVFYNCTSLAELDLQSFDVSNVTNAQSMFAGCTKLEAIYATSDWSAKINGTSSGMFSNCPKLCGSAGTSQNNSYVDKTYARLDGGPSSPGYFSQKGADLAYAVVTKNADNKPISVAFYYDKLKDTRTGDNVTIIRTLNASNVYSNWAGSTLTSVTFDESFAGFDGLTSLYRWFENCLNLTTISGLEYLNTENVTNMENMFRNCKVLTSLDLSHFNTENVTSMYNMFNICEKLTELDLTNFNVSKVTNTGYMFSGCKLLETIYATGDWNTTINTFGSDMFYNCSKLVGGAATAYSSSKTDKTYAHVDGGPSNPGYFTEKDASIPYAVVTKDAESKPVSVAFYYDKLKDTRAGENTTIVRALNASNVYTNWAGNTLTSVTFDESFANFDGLIRLNRWFENCQSLTTINGLSNLNTENVTTMALMFYNCNALTSLDLSNFNTENVTDMQYMFYNCRVLTSLDLSHFNTEKVTDMRYMFYNCKALTSLDLSNFNTANVTSMQNMFHLCEGLTSLDVSSFNTANVTDMQYMFHSCQLLTELDLTHFDTSNVTTMERMFYYCRALTSLDLTNFNVSSATNLISMFSECRNLKTIYATSDWNAQTSATSSSMFYNCLNLRGGAGTEYDSSKTDKTYARLDATGNPGYFTDKNAFLRGDVNGDGSVTIADVTTLVNIILGKNEAPANGVADVNNDTTVTIADVTTLVNIILGKE